MAETTTSPPAWPSADMAPWVEIATAALKGAAVGDRLVSRSLDGIATPALVTRTGAAAVIAAAGPVGAQPFTRGVHRDPLAGWVVAQRIDVPGVAAAQAQMLEDLRGGASGLVIALDDIGAAPKDLSRLFEDVHIDLVPITFEARGLDRAAFAEAFLDLAGERRIDADALTFHPGFDPFSEIARGTAQGRPEALVADAVAATTALAGRGLKGPTLFADGRPWHDAGASEARELGIALASAVALLRASTDAGVDPEVAADRIAFKLAVDVDQFRSIAKIRAARLLWSSVLDASGLAPRAADVRVELGRRGLTRRDPWVNILRATIAGFAGAVAGANEIVLLPYTDRLGVPDAEARRLSRNTQLILRDECALHRLADPGGGSGTIETLTMGLAEAAWAVMAEIEALGGMGPALAAGRPQALSAEGAAERAKKIARRTIRLTGVSEFPNLDEVLPTTPGRTESAGSALPTRPDDGAYEALRLRAEAFAERHGARPRAFLAAIGPPSETIARATWTKAFVEAGGIAGHVSEPLLDDAALASAFAGSGAAVAILCASDEVYAARAASAIATLRAAGAAHVLVAGKASEATGAADGHVSVGVDVVAALGALHDRIDALHGEARR